MIGLSLSFCIKDILDGKIDISEVDKIITGTKIELPVHMEGVLERYMGMYWNDNPRALEYVCKLWRENKIEQPRVKGLQPPYIAEGHWMNEEGKIVRL